MRSRPDRACPPPSPHGCAFQHECSVDSYEVASGGGGVLGRAEPVVQVEPPGRSPALAGVARREEQGFQHVEALLAQCGANRVHDRGFVVDHEDASLRRAGGHRTPGRVVTAAFNLSRRDQWWAAEDSQRALSIRHRRSSALKGTPPVSRSSTSPAAHSDVFTRTATPRSEDGSCDCSGAVGGGAGLVITTSIEAW